MACKDHTGEWPWLDAMAQFEFRDAILCPYQMTIGGPEFATMIIGVVGMAYMIRQGSPAIAAVVMIICGGVFVSQISGVAVGIVTVVVLTMFGLIPVLIIRRMSRG